MSTTENTTGPDSQAVGSVVVLYDNARAISPDGVERLLSVGSPIYANDRIVTESDGRISIVIDDAAHTQIDLDRMSEILIDEDIFGGVSSGEIAEATAEIEEVQEAFFFENTDLTVEHEAQVADVDRVTHEGDVSTSPAEKINVIFDHSDYADLNNENSGDPLDNLIDGEDSTS
jgi:hypothetical protein